MSCRSKLHREAEPTIVSVFLGKAGYTSNFSAGQLRMILEGEWCEMAGGTKLVAHPEYPPCALIERDDGTLALEEIQLLAGEPLLRIKNPLVSDDARPA